MARCFVCVDPGDEVRNRIAIVARELRQFGVPMRYVPPEQYHINLEFLGEVAAEQVEAAKLRWAALAKGAAPFEVLVRGVSAFPDEGRPRVVFTSCGSPALQKLGVGEEGRPFKPHITIGRVKLAKGNSPGIFNKFGKLDFGSFVAKEILLKESLLGESGATHETIGRFKLGKWQ